MRRLGTANPWSLAPALAALGLLFGCGRTPPSSVEPKAEAPAAAPAPVRETVKPLVRQGSDGSERMEDPLYLADLQKLSAQSREIAMAAQEVRTRMAGRVRELAAATNSPLAADVAEIVSLKQQLDNMQSLEDKQSLELASAEIERREEALSNLATNDAAFAELAAKLRRLEQEAAGVQRAKLDLVRSRLRAQAGNTDGVVMARPQHADKSGDKQP